MPARRKFWIATSEVARQRPRLLRGEIFFIALAIFLFCPKEVFAATFSFSGAPASINENASFMVTVTIEGLTAGNKYYLRAAFSHPDTPTSYFGYTKNNSEIWYNGKPSPIDHTQFFQITIKPDKAWSGSLEVKPDTEASGYKGAATYNLKIGRYTEAGSGPTWTDNTEQIAIITEATPTPPSSPSFTPTPSPTTATYKINEVKDEDGNTLSSVKVYVDGVYLHHYAPETLTFCDGCQCDTYVDCGFGEHTFKLEKSGFANWSETKTIEAGDIYEVNPIMSLIDTNSSLSPVLTPSPTPSPSPKPIKVIGATLSGEVLGEKESSPVAFYPWEASEEAKSQEATGTSKFKFIPKLFLGLGLIFLVATGISIWYTRLG